MERWTFSEGCSPPASTGRPFSPLLIGRPPSRCDGSHQPYASRVTVATPKTVRPVVDLQLPRPRSSPGQTLSRFSLERNDEIGDQIREIYSRPATVSQADEASQEHPDWSEWMARGKAGTVLEDALSKLADREVHLGGEQPEQEELPVKPLGATSVPKFATDRERSSWFFDRACEDIAKRRPHKGQGQAGLALAKMLPFDRVREINLFRKEADGMQQLRDRIEDRVKALSFRPGSRGPAFLADPKDTFIYRNKHESSKWATPAERSRRGNIQLRRRAKAKDNYVQRMAEKTEWNRKLLEHVAHKSKHADYVIWKRKQDAIREGRKAQASKLLAVCSAAVRISVLCTILPRARKWRKFHHKRTNAANTIVKFYRTAFALIHFRNYKNATLKLRGQFQLFLPIWRLRRQMRLAKIIVDFTQGVSGAGGTVAAIYAFRGKVAFLQRSVRHYLTWKHAVMYKWLETYNARHLAMLVEREALRKELFRKAAKESSHIALDDHGFPVACGPNIANTISLEVALQQLLLLFKSKRETQREMLTIYGEEAREFKSQARARLRLRLAQKSIQGDKFNIEEALEKEEKKGVKPLVAPTRPHLNSELPKEMLEEMIRQGSRVMDAEEDIEISETAKAYVQGKFKHAARHVTKPPSERPSESDLTHEEASVGDPEAASTSAHEEPKSSEDPAYQCETVTCDSPTTETHEISADAVES